MRHHLGITHQILRVEVLLNWFGRVLPKTRFNKGVQRWAWETAQETDKRLVKQRIFVSIYS